MYTNWDRETKMEVPDNILKREAETNKQLYNGLLQRFKETSVSSGLRASSIVVAPAESTTYMDKPLKLLNLTLALMIDLRTGIDLAFFQEYPDNTWKTPEDAQRFLRLSAMYVIPAANANGRRQFLYGSGGYSSRKPLPEVQAEGKKGNQPP